MEINKEWWIHSYVVNDCLPSFLLCLWWVPGDEEPGVQQMCRGNLLTGQWDQVWRVGWAASRILQRGDFHGHGSWLIWEQSWQLQQVRSSVWTRVRQLWVNLRQLSSTELLNDSSKLCRGEPALLMANERGWEVKSVAISLLSAWSPWAHQQPVSFRRAWSCSYL